MQRRFEPQECGKPERGPFQHLQGTLSISFGIRRASVGRAGECLALSVLPIGSDA
jgi:hypothetical protein